MKKIILCFVFLPLFLSCEKETTTLLEPIHDIQHPLIPRTPPATIDVCHHDAGNDTWHIINISINAWQGHQSHGDAQLIDDDGDGWISEANACISGVDCDDSNAETYPGADELCFDNIDNNCDGQIDENCPLIVILPDSTTLYVHPTDNNLFGPLPWCNSFGVDIIELPNIALAQDAIQDFNGESNTDAIVTQVGSNDEIPYPAKICSDLVAFGFDDWYLPSAGELYIMDLQLNFEIRLTPLSSYWSSTEVSGIRAWLLNFNTGFLFDTGKIFPRQCRCVRK